MKTLARKDFFTHGRIFFSRCVTMLFKLDNVLQTTSDAFQVMSFFPPLLVAESSILPICHMAIILFISILPKTSPLPILPTLTSSRFLPWRRKEKADVRDQ